jgi:gas vesicle protein
MTSNTKIILGLMAAAAAGAALGVLMAPEKGSDLRRKIKDTMDEWVDDLSELLAIGQEKMKESFAEAREGMEEVKDTVSDTYKRRRGNN